MSSALCSIVEYEYHCLCFFSFCFFFQAEDGIRDLVRSRGLGDVYKRQTVDLADRVNRANTLVGLKRGDEARTLLEDCLVENLSLIHI